MSAPAGLPWRVRREPDPYGHVRLEFAVSAIGPLPEARAVPGCGCPACLTFAAGGTQEDAELAEDLVRHLAELPPSERAGAVEDVRAEREARGLPWRLPQASTLALLASLVPGAVRAPARDRRGRRREERRREWERAVEAARAVPVSTAADRLGLERHPRRDDLARCPFHDDENPSLHLNDAKGAAFCNPCGRSWDAIALVMEVRRVEFVDAVRELAEGRSWDTRQPANARPARNAGHVSRARGAG